MVDTRQVTAVLVEQEANFADRVCDVSYVPQVCHCCTCVWPPPSGLPLTTDHTMAVNKS